MDWVAVYVTIFVMAVSAVFMYWRLRNKSQKKAIREEELNFWKVYLLCYKVATESVRMYLHRCVPVTALETHLLKWRTKLDPNPPNRTVFRCYPAQFDLLFPDIDSPCEKSKNKKKVPQKRRKATRRKLVQVQHASIIPETVVITTLDEIRQLNQHEEAPPAKVCSSTFDFSLLYKLIRNTLSLTNKWNQPLSSLGTSELDDIERIHHYRNLLAHNTKMALSKSDFKAQWNELSQAVSRLSRKTLLNNIKELENQTLNFRTREKLLEEMKTDLEFVRRKMVVLQRDVSDHGTQIEEHGAQIQEHETHIQEHDTQIQEHDTQIQEHETHLKEHSTEIQKLKSSIPANVRKGQITQLDAWAAEDLVFYSGIAAVKEVTDKVKDHQIVTIIGGPGAGKTSIARHIALEYQKQKFEVVPICQPEDIIQFGDNSVSQVFVLDDVLGVFSFDVSLYNKLNNTKISILSAIGKQSKLICTCRTLVYNQAYKVGSFVLENVIDVESKSNKITVSDKINIFKNHCTDKNIKETFDNLSFENCHFMFPLLCRIFAASDKHLKNPKTFFHHPVECVKNELEKMSKMEKTQYAVLVLCMMNSKKILRMDKPLTSINKDLTHQVFDLCSDCANPTNSQVNQALQHLSGTYLTEYVDHYTFIHDSIYEVSDLFTFMLKGFKTKLNPDTPTHFTFIHDSIYEIVAYHFGTQHVDLMIEYMSSTFVRNKLVISGGESVDQLSIEVTEDMYPLLADRLLKDIKDGKLYDVFTNTALSHRHFVDVFMDVLKKKLSYQQFREMFLTVMKGNTQHITQQSKKMAVNKEEGTRNYGEEERQRLLLGQYNWSKYSIRIISFIIYYGHSHLLQSIIDYVASQHHKVVDYFLSKQYKVASVIGSDLSEQSRLLTLAVYHGNKDVLQVLLKYTESNAVNVSAVGDGLDRYNNYHRKHTLLTAACYVGNMFAVKILLEMNGIINPENKPYHTPLTAASVGGHLDIVIHLVKHGGDVNLCTKYNESPLYAAARGGHLHIGSFLVEHGGDVNLCNMYNESPLFIAAWLGHLDIVSFMVNHGGDVNLCTKYNNESPLYTAARGGHLDIISFLVEHGGDVNLCDVDNRSPLYTAAGGGHLGIVSYLVNHGGDVNLCNKYNQSPLYTAAMGGHLGIVSFLVNHGGDVNLCNKYNESPLHAASLWGQYDIVRFLLENGGKVNHGKSPIDVARRSRHEDIVELLQNYQSVN